MQKPWYQISNAHEIDSPSLLIYKERVQANIEQMLAMAKGPQSLVPHVKTNKMPEIIKMMLKAGIKRFKCATIAEAEMLAIAGAKYVLIAHQLVGPKIQRLIKLREKYTEVFFASLIDCYEIALLHQEICTQHNLSAHIFLDINNGMNRSGFPLNEDALAFYKFLHEQSKLNCLGLHVYDGHLRDENFDLRKNQIQEAFLEVQKLEKAIEAQGLPKPEIIAGGSPSFPAHASNPEVFSSPGTCVLWDWGYNEKLQEQAFQYAALVLTRVISKPSPGLVTIDLGHKAIAPENPINRRVRFLNFQGYELISQSEEHGVLKVDNWEQVKVGDIFYGIPYHICPTVNLYDEAHIVTEGDCVDKWEILGRKRRIEI